MQERLDEHERILTRHGLELVGLDRRVSIVESDQASVRQLSSTTLALSQRIGEFADGIDAVAERAVETVLERRDEHEQERRDRHVQQRRAAWTHRTSVAVAVASLAGFIFNLLHGF